MIKRRKTRKVFVGRVPVGGNAPISIQSMTNMPFSDVKGTIKQIHELEEAGCEIIRVAIPNMEAIKTLKEIKRNIHIALVVDIHFDHRLALAAMDAGVDKVRINPGNMRDPEKVREVVRKAKSLGIPIRVGANSGSILPRNKTSRNHPRHATAEFMVKAVLRYLRIFEKENFRNIVVSLKSSSVCETIKAYEIFSKKSDYPLHLGITAAGTDFSGTIKSCVGIGSLLWKGIGDTIRVSLTGDPVEEVRVAKEILQSLGLRSFHPEIISCPTCSRCRIDLIPLVHNLEKSLNGIKKPVKVALMGCEVNGPGEAADADFGIAAGKDSGMLFRKGQPVKRVKLAYFVKTLIEETKKWQPK
jgi:(E)-4-hydroxy-3-methylbut-2-enyl-diphosphate synthase